MAIWDAAAKIAGLPVYRYLAQRVGRATNSSQTVRVYAGGGYYYPRNDIARLSDEVRQLRALGYTDVKIKIGGVPLSEDLRRIEAVARLLPDADRLAVDAMNTYNPSDSMGRPRNSCDTVSGGSRISATRSILRHWRPWRPSTLVP